MLSEEGAESKELNGSYELALKIVFFYFKKLVQKCFLRFFLLIKLQQHLNILHKRWKHVQSMLQFLLCPSQCECLNKQRIASYPKITQFISWRCENVYLSFANIVKHSHLFRALGAWEFVFFKDTFLFFFFFAEMWLCLSKHCLLGKWTDCRAVTRGIKGRCVCCLQPMETAGEGVAVVTMAT